MPRNAKTLQPRSRAALAAAALIALGFAGLAWQRGWLRPAPTVVAPAAPELLDPAVRRLVERSVAEASERPRDAELHGRLGMIYEANSLWPEARDAYRRAVELDPDSRAWSYHFAIAIQQAGDFAAALELYRRLAREHPTFAPVHHRLGVALLETAEIEDALAAFRRVVELRPDHPSGHAGVGAALRLLGRADGAAESLERAISLDPGHRSANYQLGLVYRELGRTEAAERHLGIGLAATLETLPDELTAEIDGYAVSLPATVERAEALRRAGRHTQVATLFEQALDRHPDNLTLLNNLAGSYLAQGELDRARETLDRAQAVHGDDTETLLNLAGWALAAGRPEASLGYADRALALDDRLARLHGVRAQALIRLRRYTEATESMEAALRLEVRDPALYLGLGVLYESASRWAAAREIYERALSNWPDLVPAHVGVAFAALAVGDRGAALRAGEAIRRLAPDHPRLAELERSLR